jgi:hypothetical protein
VERSVILEYIFIIISLQVVIRVVVKVLRIAYCEAL